MGLAFAVVEVAIRYALGAYPFDSDQAFENISHLTDKDRTLRWRFSPNRDGRNSLGLANDEIEPKRDHQLRILYLGDSLVWSGRTSSGKQYTEVIEDTLNQSDWIDKEIEVINAGIPGYTTYQELEFLKIYGLNMRPDIVILGFVFNDVHYKYLHRPGEESLLEGEPTVHLSRFDVRGFPGSLFARSYAIHTLVFLAGRLFDPSDFTFERRGDFYLAWKHYGWTKTRELLLEMKNLLDERDIQLHLVVYPVSEQIDRYLDPDRKYVLYPQSRIAEICEDYGISCLDLTESIYRNGGTELFTDYLHLNEKGNDLVAERVVEYLRSFPDQAGFDAGPGTGH